MTRPLKIRSFRRFPNTVLCNQTGTVFAVMSSRIALAWHSGMETVFQTNDIKTNIFFISKRHDNAIQDDITAKMVRSDCTTLKNLTLLNVTRPSSGPKTLSTRCAGVAHFSIFFTFTFLHLLFLLLFFLQILIFRSEAPL